MLIVTKKKQEGKFEVWSKSSSKILHLDFRYLLTHFSLWHKPYFLLHYRAFPLDDPGWGILDCEAITYTPGIDICNQEWLKTRFIIHPDRNLKVRPTSCCLIKKEDFLKYKEKGITND